MLRHDPPVDDALLPAPEPLTDRELWFLLDARAEEIGDYLAAEAPDLFRWDAVAPNHPALAARPWSIGSPAPDDLP